MADVKLKPLADRVLVEPKEAETKTASGIFIPDTAREKPQQGKVVAVSGSGNVAQYAIEKATQLGAKVVPCDVRT